MLLDGLGLHTLLEILMGRVAESPMGKLFLSLASSISVAIWGFWSVRTRRSEVKIEEPGLLTVLWSEFELSGCLSPMELGDVGLGKSRLGAFGWRLKSAETHRIVWVCNR